MSLRETLARKQRRETHFEFLVCDPTDAEKAEEDAERAAARAVAVYGEDSDEATAARTSLAEARAALAACVERITFRNLPSDDFDALISACPPADDQDGMWNPVTFAPALVAACAADSDLTAEDWTAEFTSDRWSRADKNAIFAAALEANTTARSVSVPKD